MLRVFGETGFEVTRRYVGGAVEVEFELTSSPEVLDRIAQRDHSAVSASLQPFFQPRSVAVIVSARRGTIGGELFRNVIAADFDGAAYPVNSKGDAVGGVRGYTSIREIRLRSTWPWSASREDMFSKQPIRRCAPKCAPSV
jgi:hypothetical protein